MLEFIDDCVDSLANTSRWATYDTLESPSVAEHSFLVAHIGYAIAFSTDECDEDEVLKRALFHDMEEAYTGDIPRFAKRGNKDFESALATVETEAVTEMTDSLPSEFQNHIVSVWDAAKDDSIEGKTLAQADILATVYDMYTECLQGNQKLMKHKDIQRGIEYAEEVCSENEIAVDLLDSLLTEMDWEAE